MASSAAKGYGAAWRKLRASILARDPVCGLCGAASVVADHIVPRRAGGSDSPENLMGLCRSCHSVKTASQDGGFGNPTGGGITKRRQRVLDRLRRWWGRVGLTEADLIRVRRAGARFHAEQPYAGRVGRHYYRMRVVVCCRRPCGGRLALWPGKGRGRRTTWEVGRWRRDYRGWSSVGEEGEDKLYRKAEKLADRLNQAAAEL